MTDDQQVQQLISDLVIRSAVQFAQGKARADILDNLQSDGCPPDLAVAIANRGLQIKRREFRMRGLKGLGVGCAMLALGAVITFGTYSVAASGGGGGTYVVATGLFGVGLVSIVMGAWRSAVG